MTTRQNTSLAPLFELQSVAIDPSRSDPRGGSLRTGIDPPIGMAPWLGSSVLFPDTHNAIPEVVGRSGLGCETLQFHSLKTHNAIPQGFFEGRV